MTPTPPSQRCEHECVCNKYIDYTNTGATAGRVCNGETWCFKPCPHDTRLLPPRVPLTPALTAYYTERSRDTGKPIPQLVLQDLAALHRKRVAKEEKRVWKENEFERL